MLHAVDEGRRHDRPAVQRLVSLHGQLSAQHHGGVRAQSMGIGKFKAFGAGSHPKGGVHPLALHLLAELKYETKDLRSKSWKEFEAPDGPHLDFVTVCDAAAAEPCPLWPGKPITAHWGVADPAAFDGTDEEKRRFFFRTYRELEKRVKSFVKLKLDARTASRSSNA